MDREADEAAEEAGSGAGASVAAGTPGTLVEAFRKALPGPAAGSITGRVVEVYGAGGGIGEAGGLGGGSGDDGGAGDRDGVSPAGRTRPGGVDRVVIECVGAPSGLAALRDDPDPEARRLAVALEAAWAEATWRRIECDANGEFTLPDLPDGRYRLRAHHPTRVVRLPDHLASERWPVLRPGQRVTLRLLPQVVREVKIDLRRPDGTPAPAGTPLFVQSPPVDTPTHTWSPKAPTLWLPVGAVDLVVYVFTAGPDDIYRLAPTRVEVPPADEAPGAAAPAPLGLALTLERLPVLRGRVRLPPGGSGDDADHGAWVRILHLPPGAPAIAEEVALAGEYVTVHADGRFSVLPTGRHQGDAAFEAGTYAITAGLRAPGQRWRQDAPAPLEVIDVVPGLNRIEFALHPTERRHGGSPILVRVRAPDGSPITPTRVHLRVGGARASHHHRVEAALERRGVGEVVVIPQRDLAAVAAEEEGEIQMVVGVDDGDVQVISLGPRPPAEVDVTLRLPAQVSITVGREAAPAAQWMVVLKSRGADDGSARSAFGLREPLEDGRAAFAGLRPGPWTLFVVEGFDLVVHRQDVELQSGANVLDVHIPEPASLVVHVPEAAGASHVSLGGLGLFDMREADVRPGTDHVFERVPPGRVTVTLLGEWPERVGAGGRGLRERLTERIIDDLAPGERRVVHLDPAEPDVAYRVRVWPHHGAQRRWLRALGFDDGDAIVGFDAVEPRGRHAMREALARALATTEAVTLTVERDGTRRAVEVALRAAIARGLAQGIDLRDVFTLERR